MCFGDMGRFEIEERVHNGDDNPERRRVPGNEIDTE
jgi:hypothetical protein